MKRINPEGPEYHINRELGWLAFNRRVLEESGDKANPLFERLKFLAITVSNLDEFYMVRVGSLNDQVEAGYDKVDASGLTPSMQLSRISSQVHRLSEEICRIWSRKLSPKLGQAGFRILSETQLTETQKEWLSEHFDRFIYPVLTPMAVDSGRPFPLIQNKSMNIGVLLKDETEDFGVVFATVQSPSVLDRLVVLPEGEEGGTSIVLMEDIITMFIERLFIGKEVLAAAPYRVTRNGDLAIDEDEAEDLLLEIQKSLKQRRWGVAVRLEVQKGVDPRLRSVLLDELELTEEELYEISGPIDLTFLFRLYQYSGTSTLKFAEHHALAGPGLMDREDLFATIREGDILMHHPFESFDPVVDMIRTAARDPGVLAIKQTLYRVSGTSPIVRALAEAAENGKQVTVLVELKARFDEENNIQWARQLEKAGCHVIYGLVGLKTHSKIVLIVRMEEDGIRRYVHISTGNYNDVTARIYTDMSLLTCDSRFAEDASTVFNAISGFSDRPKLRKLVMAPTGLREKFYELIDREVSHAIAGRKARIVAKLNSLVDPGIIGKLYEASMAGVEIDLIVRGMCSLRPGMEGVSRNIRVRSIVGRFLEHSRIYRFENGGSPQVFLSSADWMERNLDRRVELLFPIEDENLKLRIDDILKLYLTDNVKARIMQPDGSYHRVKGRRTAPVHAQEALLEMAAREASVARDVDSGPVFNVRTQEP